MGAVGASVVVAVGVEPYGRSLDDVTAEAQALAEELWAVVVPRIPPLVPGRAQGPEPGSGFMSPGQFYIALAIVIGRVTAVDAYTKTAGAEAFLEDFSRLLRLHLPRPARNVN